jgi:hypothetical protein
MDRYEAALKAINHLYSDMSVSQSATRDNLRGLIDEIETLIETLTDD